jgi:hypothetical protein
MYGYGQKLDRVVSDCLWDVQNDKGKGFMVELGERNIRPFAVTRRDMERVLQSPRLVQRLLHTTKAANPASHWLKLVRPGGRGSQTLVSTASFENALARIEAGETPPLLPSETRRNAQTARRSAIVADSE